ncbi:MAG: alkaline phosphatase PhoX [Candidatus Aminicenantaceae bacterium]
MNKNSVPYGYGPLKKDRRGVIDLPEGFEYKIISRMGDKMDDGFYVPGLPDGMGTFPGPDGLTIILRNHEVRFENQDWVGAFKGKKKLWEKLDKDLIYDTYPEGKPLLGAVTTLVYNTKMKKLISQHLSLVGTVNNCSGGSTPWGTWISCEENCENSGDVCLLNHGYAFEIPVSTESKIIKPVPLKSMGRFTREGIAVDPKSNVIYQTEDKTDCLFYRFLPNKAGMLSEGGRLQCLAIIDKPKLDTRNWKVQRIPPGQAFDVYWIDLENPDAEEDDLRLRGHEKGATLFASGEGIVYHDGAVYFSCTNGGTDAKGQIWRYFPGPYEGKTEEKDSPGRLELFVEPNNLKILDHPDQLAVSPWDDIFVCEDGDGEQFLVGITQERQFYKFARNALDESELSGVCFSLDETTMFVNNLKSGLTFAITGPWKK